MQLYTGLVTRGNENWIVKVENLPEGHTVIGMGKTWKKAKVATEEAADVATRQPPGTVKIDMKFENEELEALVEKVRQSQLAAREAQDELQTVLGLAARRLTQKATVRDVAEILGYSHQYIAKMSPRGDA